MAQGDVHFRITADDQATAVLDEFKSGVEKSLESISSAMDGALGKIDSLASGTTGVLEKLLEIVSNPSPWTVVSAAVAGAGAAFLYLKNQVSAANEEFQKADRITQAMEAISAKVGDLRFSNDTDGMSSGQRDIAAFGREVDAKPFQGLDKADRERRNYLREYIDNPNIWDSGKSDKQALQVELDALNKKEAEAIKREQLLRDEQKRNYADQINRRTSSERQAESQKAFDAMFKQMDDTLGDARYGAKTAGMTSEVEKKLAAFDRAYQKMDQSKLGDAEREKLAEAYEVQRRRLETELEIEASAKRKVELEKQSADAAEEAARNAKAESDRLTARGDAIRKAMLTPQEKYDESKSELERLRASDKIDQQTFVRALAAALKESQAGQQQTTAHNNWKDPLKPAANNAPIVSRFLTRGAGDTWDPLQQLMRDQLVELRQMKHSHILLRKWLDDFKAWIEGRGNRPGKRPLQPIPGGP